MKKLVFLCMICFVSFMLNGCSRASEDDELSMIPTTNNPNIVPNNDSFNPLTY